MLKIAFEAGVKLAYDEALGLTSDQMGAAKGLGMAGGGALGAGLGGLLGRYVGGQVADASNRSGFLGGLFGNRTDPGLAKNIGTGRGALAGGALGAWAGRQAPQFHYRQQQDPGTQEDYSALGLLDSAYDNADYYGLDGVSDFSPYYGWY